MDHKFELNSLEYDFGLLTVDNKIKPQGRKFKELADQYRGKPVRLDALQAKPLPPAPASHAETWKWILNWLGYEPKREHRSARNQRNDQFTALKMSRRSAFTKPRTVAGRRVRPARQ